MKAKNHNYSWALFQLWDNKDPYKELIKRAKPNHDYSSVKVSSDSD